MSLTLALRQYDLAAIKWQACIMISSPSAVVIDSQSVKTSESDRPRGFDAGKKIKGRKRHIVTDTQGNLVGFIVHEADVQDRDGAPRLLASIRSLYPRLRHVFADGSYAGDKLRVVLKNKGSWTLEIIKRSGHRQGLRDFCPAAWLSNGRSLGLDVVAASPRASRRQSPAPSQGCSSGTSEP